MLLELSENISEQSKMIMTEEREFVLLLIALYKDNPHLWQIKSKDYANKQKRSAALKDMVNTLKKYKPDFNEDKLKKKINTLRTNFNKEFQKIERSKRLGISCEEVLEPTLWYYNNLLFIKDQPIVAETEISGEILRGQNKLFGDENETKPPKRKKTSDGTTKKLLNLAREYSKKPDTEVDLLAKSWAMKLNRIAPEQRLLAEKIINDTLFEAESGTLTRDNLHLSPYQQYTPSTSSLLPITIQTSPYSTSESTVHSNSNIPFTKSLEIPRMNLYKTEKP